MECAACIRDERSVDRVPNQRTLEEVGLAQLSHVARPAIGIRAASHAVAPQHRLFHTHKGAVIGRDGAAIDTPQAV